MLTDRDPQAANFSAWQRDATLRLAPRTDRAHVRAYASWQVATQLASRARGGAVAHTSQKYARTLVTEAINLTGWLHDQQLELTDLRQDLVDTWVLGGGSQRRRVKLFLRWLVRAGVIGPMDVAWEQHPATRAAMDDRQRLELLARLLDDDQLAATDRLAGCLLLLYAQPLTRIVTLTTSDLAMTPDETAEITLGRGAVQLPESLTGAVRSILNRSGHPDRDGSAWLFTGRHAGSHLTAGALSQRLRQIGVRRAVNARHAAMLALAGRLPAPILAQRIGIDQSRAAGWARLAGAPYAEYVRIRQTDLS